MKAIIEYNSRKIQIDVSKPIDISIAIDITKENVNAENKIKVAPISNGTQPGLIITRIPIKPTNNAAVL